MRATKSVPPGLGLFTSAMLALSANAVCVTALHGQTTTAAETTPSRHSTVSFQDGLLTVTASNASLNGILREVARTTGMKISGSIPDDRVFGTYGPEDPQKVLGTLLDGTGTNILILSNTADKPLELVLTHRTGGATPPPTTTETTNATSDADGDDTDQATTVQQASPVTPQPAVQPRQRGPQSQNLPTSSNQPSEVSQPVIFAPIGATTAPATATTTPADPDDANDTGTESVKTPQQIFEQLQKLQGNNQNGGVTQDPQ